MSKDMGDAPSSDASAADIACLTGARKSGLVRKMVLGLYMPGSELKDVAWWVKSSYGPPTAIDSIADAGPWSVEQVAKLIAQGLLKLNAHYPTIANISRAGRSRLKPIAAKSKSEDGSSPQNLQPGE